MNKYLLLVFVHLVCLKMSALPTDPVVVAGQIDFCSKSTSLHLKSHSKHAIVNWKSFSSHLGEAIKMDMPDASSAILNRVTSNTPTELMGSLISNGHVYLINQNGVLFGKNCFVRVGGLTASTLDLSDDLFLNQKDLVFSGTSKASVKNLGHILAQSGDTRLIGSQIVNQGSITCPKGNALLLAGSKVLIQSDEHALIEADPAQIQDFGIDQSGAIYARNIEAIADGSLYKLAIKHTGEANAVGFEKQGGTIRLIAQRGSVDVGGLSRLCACSDDGSHKVEVCGQKVALKDQTLIDVSAESYPGKVVIGRDKLKEKTHSTDSVFVDESVRVLCDAKLSGDGGKILVWSDGKAQFNGFGSVRGGHHGGNGGFAEISGETLSVTGVVDARAPCGEFGTILWDPTDITIGIGGSSNISITGLFSKTISGTAATSFLGIGTLNTNLTLGNVTVTTFSGSGGDGDLSFSDDVTINALLGTNLTFNIANDLNLSQDVTFQGLLESSQLTFNVTNDFNVTSASTFAFEGNLFDCNIGNDVNFSADFTYDDTSVGSGAVASIVAGGKMTFDGAVQIQSAGSFTFEASDLMAINAPVTTTSTPSVVFRTNGAMPSGPYDPDPSIVINVGGAISTDANQLTCDSAHHLFIHDHIENVSSGDISLDAISDMFVGGGPESAAVATPDGEIVITVGGDLSVIGGYGSDAFSQIGAQSTSVLSDIIITVGQNLVVQGGSSSNGAYAHIGHGSLNADGGTLSGNIDILTVGDSLQVYGGHRSECFAQIGHLNGSTTSSVTIGGDITNGLGGAIAVPGIFFCRGGFADGAYALFGHGGRASESPDNFSGTIRLQAEHAVVRGGTSNKDSAFAAFGFYVDEAQGPAAVSVSSSLIELIGTQTLSISSYAKGNAAVGARVITSEYSSADIDVSQINVSTDWLAINGGVHQVGPNEVCLGAFGGGLAGLTSANSSTDVVSNLTIDVGESFELTVGNFGSETQVQALITNGNMESASVSGHSFNFSVGGDTIIVAGLNCAAIRAIDTLDFSTEGDLLLIGGKSGAAFIDCQSLSGSSVVSSGMNIECLGESASYRAFIQSTSPSSSQTLLVQADGSIELGQDSYIEHKGSGDLTLVVDNAFPSPPYFGSGAFSLDSASHVGRLGGGSLRIFTAERSQNTVAGANNINGQTFVPGPLFVDSQTEHWGVYYPDAFIGSETYTLFYKNQS